MDSAKFIPVHPYVETFQGNVLRLLDYIESLYETRVPGKQLQVRLIGDGSSQALLFLESHLAAIEDIAVLHDDYQDEIPFQKRMVIVAKLPHAKFDQVIPLLDWDRDTLAEYLLQNHPDACKSVMQRLSAERGGSASGPLPVGGSPFVWQPILEEMVRDDALSDPREALHRVLRSQLQGVVTLFELSDLLLKQKQNLTFEAEGDSRFTSTVGRILRRPEVRATLMIDRCVERLKNRDVACLREWMDESIIHGIARRISNERKVVKLLETMSNSQDCGSIEVSLLASVKPTWKPNFRTGVSLQKGDFSGVDWSQCRFTDIDFSGSNLGNSNLRQCRFAKGKLTRASFYNSNLVQSTMIGCDGFMIDFSNADLTDAKIADLRFAKPLFQRSCLRAAHFSKMVLEEPDFSQADLTGASFIECTLDNAAFQDANVSDCRFDRSNLWRIDFRSANLKGAKFSGSNMESCNLEDCRFESVDFQIVNFTRALLTGSKARGVIFGGALFAHAGLADINWENCDLRESKILRVSFHLGSTRSGLVGSPYPSHGTRTGFYTDDYCDLNFKNPEAIRKASLVGCDLRGADVDSTDFYLVDMRDVRCDDSQLAHFRSCGAIL